MKLFKKLSLLIISAVTAIVFIAVPTSADGGADSASVTYNPVDISGFKRYTGGEMRENQNYYIDGDVKISGKKTVTVPKNSRLVVRGGSSLTVYFGSSLVVKGELTVEPSANVAVSGEFVSHDGATVYNYGNFSGTTSSVMHLSSIFVVGSTGITALSGEISVYRQGLIIVHNRFTIAKPADVTLTGQIICEKSGQVFIKGVLSITMSGEIISNGTLCLYKNTYCGGEVTLNEGSEFIRLNGGRFTFTKAGRFNDNRVPAEDSSKDEEIELVSYPKTKDETSIDKESDEVHWLGVDVSRYQGAIDWERVKASGVDFVLLRSSIGDGTETISGEDIRFAKNAVQAKEAGLMVGAYHYLWAETPQDARIEARFFIKTIEPYDLDFPAILDFEEPSQQDNLTNEERTEIAKVFLEEVKRAGYYPMLYTNKSWATTYLNMDELSEYEVWLAEWFPDPSYQGDYGIWQYTAYGKVAGIDGGVDLDVCYKNYPKMIRESKGS